MFFNQNGNWKWDEYQTTITTATPNTTATTNTTATKNVTFIKWKEPGEPSGDGNCAAVFPDATGLNDYPCIFERRFICERSTDY